MISIVRATEKDYEPIVRIGRVAVADAHRESCSAEALNQYLETHYNDDAIRAELNDPKNVYHIIHYDHHPVGFSKIILNVEHSNLVQKNVTKLDRIYLSEEYRGLKLGYELLKFNIEFSKKNNQSGMWLFTWVENHRAVNFYLKAGFSIVGSHMFKVTETHYNQNHHMFLDLLTSESE